MHIRHREFRPVYVERQYSNLNRLFKLSCYYALLQPILYLVTTRKGDLSHILAESISLFVIAVLGHVSCILYKKLFSQKIKGNNKHLFIAEMYIYFLVMLFLFWGNIAIDVSYRRDPSPSPMVWIIVCILITALVTIMPYATFVINGATLFLTMLQYSHFVKEGAYSMDIFNFVMFSFFMTFIMIDKYIYEENSFRNTKKLKEMQEDRERFLVNMTHEMRTPLNAILGKNELICNDTKEEQTKALTKEIGASGKVLLSTINDILDLSKMESGKMNIIPVDYSTRNITYEIADILRSEATAKGLGFKLEVSSNVPALLHGDDVRIRQVILNLLSNAIKYTKEGSVTLRVWFDAIDKARNCGTLHVMIVDTGIGIKHDDIPKLKKAFSRVNEEENRMIQGTGLGLAITSSLLKLMNSELKVESEYEIGSTFSFDIEQGIVDETSLRDTINLKEPEERVYFKAPNASVLVVDDNYVNFSVCKGLMKYYDFEPEHVASGEACLSRIAEKKYDIILLDHCMVGLSGPETLERIKTDFPNVYASTPVVALTANDGAEREKEYLGYGFSDFLSKPIDAGRLHTILEKYLKK